MKLNKSLMIAAVAVAGLFAGNVVQAQQDTNAPGGGQRGGGRGAMTFEAISTALALTDAQKPKVQPVVEEMNKKMADMRADTSIAQADRRAKSQEIRDAAKAKLKDILTPEQVTKWDEMGQRRRQGGAGAGAPPANGAAPAAAPKN